MARHQVLAHWRRQLIGRQAATDAQDRVVVRRALTPADYAPGTADLQFGIRANGEVVVKVFIDASAASQAGYRLYMFYP